MEDACAEVVASELRRRQVIPKRVETKIERALDLNEANGLLYDHLCAQGNFQTLKIVCDVFIGKQGYQQMNHLGAKMKEEMIRGNTLGMLPHVWCTLYCRLPSYAALRRTLWHLFTHVANYILSRTISTVWTSRTIQYCWIIVHCPCVHTTYHFVVHVYDSFENCINVLCR